MTQTDSATERSVPAPPVEAEPTRDTRLAYGWLAAAGFLIVGYGVLHAALGPENSGSFLWSKAPLSWIDWVCWAAAGSVLATASSLATVPVKGLRRRDGPEQSASGRVRDTLMGAAVAVILVAAAAYLPDVQVLGVEIKLKDAPTVAAPVAFVAGFYSRIARRVLFNLVLGLVRPAAGHVRGVGTLAAQDVQRYLELNVDPRLQRPYLLAASTVHGLPGHKASLERRVAYRVSGLLSRVGFTVNALRSVFLSQDLMGDGDRVLVELVAHEANHVYQDFWSDSLEQEAGAYVTAAHVMDDLARRGEVQWRDTEGWLALDHDAAENKVRNSATAIPLYGMIPRQQAPETLPDRVQFVRQAICLGLDLLLGARNPCRRQGQS